MNTATESVCPKGWTLPTTKQIDANRNTTNFNPVAGGSYLNGNPSSTSLTSVWWGSEAYNAAKRYRLGFAGSTINTYQDYRIQGFYIRCVSEEKTVTDLTYLQDMTGEIANNTLDGTTASLIT